MSENIIKYEGELNLNGFVIPCYVLEDGTRLISGRGMQEAVKLLSPSSKSSEQVAGSRMAEFTASKWFKSLIVNDLSLDDFKPITSYKGGQKISGYKATALADFCDIMLDARQQGLINTERQRRVADQCEILIRGFARVGIIALVDEATGYQNDVNRAKDELQQLLSKFILTEQARWIKTFPDEFFEMFFRMKGWNWSKAARKPQVVGHYINDFVYRGLAPAVLEELRKKNPKDEFTQIRKHKHHQWLTPDLGHPKLKEHLAGVMALGRACGYDWLSFLHLVDRSYPKFGHTMKILFPYTYKDSNGK